MKSFFTRDEASKAALQNAFKAASATFMRRVLPSLPDHFSSRDLWTSGLSQTYACELRTESSNRADSLYDFDPAYYDEVTRAMASMQSQSRFPVTVSGDNYTNKSSAGTRKLSAASWWLRRVQGKLLSMLRLIKAALTFNDPPAIPFMEN